MEYLRWWKQRHKTPAFVCLRRKEPKEEIIEEPEEASSVLSSFGRDLTQAARDNKLDPVIGRDDEIRNVIRILTRKTKNNPVLDIKNDNTKDTASPIKLLQNPKKIKNTFILTSIKNAFNNPLINL